MNILLFLIVCAVVVGSHANEVEPIFGKCDSQLSKIDGSSILGFFNAPENADVKELLRNMRDIMVLYKPTKDIEMKNDKRILDFAENIFGKNEIAYEVAKTIKIKREKNIKVGLCMINIILGVNYTDGAFDFEEAIEDLEETIEKLRVRVKNIKFDDKKFQVYIEKIQVYIEQLFGKSEVTNQFRELIKSTFEIGKQMLLNLMDAIVGDKETPGAFFPQSADVNKLLRILRDIVKKLKFDDEKFQVYIEKLIGKSEVTNQFRELIKSTFEIGKQMLLNHMDAIVGDKKTQGAFFPQIADVNKLLRKLRDIIHNFKYDDEKIRDLIETLELESEMTNNLCALLKVGREILRQRLIEFLNIILGDKEAPRGDFFHNADVNELKKLRVFIQNHVFDDGNFFHDSIERQFGMSEITDMYYELMKTMRERGRQSVLNFINEILQDKETQGTYFVQHSDSNAFRLKKRLEKLISRINNNLDNGEGVGEKHLLMKKAIAVYMKLQNLGLEPNDKHMQMFLALFNFDRFGEDEMVRWKTVRR